MSSTSAPPPLIRGTVTSNKGSQQVNALLSHKHTGHVSLWVPFQTKVLIYSDQILTGRNSGTVIPPPLVRGGQQVSSKHGSQIIMPPLVRGAQVIFVNNIMSIYWLHLRRNVTVSSCSLYRVDKSVSVSLCTCGSFKQGKDRPVQLPLVLRSLLQI